MKRRDSGQAVIEAVVLGLALFVPLIYGVVAVTGIHRTTLAADAAAHEAARAWSTSPTPIEARGRAESAARQAVSDYGFAPAEVEVRIDGQLAPGATVLVVTRLPVKGLAGLVTIERRAAADADRLRAGS